MSSSAERSSSSHPSSQGSRLILLVGGVLVLLSAGLLILVVTLRDHHATEPAPADAGLTAPALSTEVAARVPRIRRSGPTSATATRPEESPGSGTATPAPQGGTGEFVLLPRDQPLAFVNGQPLTLAQLMLSDVASGTGQVELPKEEYQARLDRAIDEELTVQAARAAGLDIQTLTEAKLRQVKMAHERRLAAAQARGATWSSASAAVLEQEARSQATIELQRQLAEQRGVSAAVPSDDEVRQYYEAHQEEYGPLPEGPGNEDAWPRMLVRIRRDFKVKYQQGVEGLLRELRGAAEIKLP